MTPASQAVEPLLGRLSRAFAAVAPDGVDRLVTEALGWIADQMDLDGALAVTLVGDRIDGSWEWTRHGDPIAPPAVGDLASDLFSTAIEALRAGIVVPIDDLGAVTLAPDEATRIREAGLRSVVAIPVRDNGVLEGFVGYATRGRTTVWDHDRLADLQHVSELVLRSVLWRRVRSDAAIADRRAMRIAAVVPDGLLFCDDHHVVTWMSPTAPSVVRRAASRLLGLSVLDMVHADDRGRVVDALQVAWREGVVGAFALRLAVDGGEHRWFEVSASRVDAPGFGPGHELLLSFRDVHRRHIEVERLADAAATDPLSGLLNRRGLRPAIDRLRPDQMPISALFLELDGFKAVNDEHGHATGDRVLVEIARRIVARVGPSTDVVRLGGDEFVVLLPGVAEPVARSIAAELTADASRPIDIDGVALALGASVGVATIASLAERSDLIAAADEAMYRIKRDRRS